MKLSSLSLLTFGVCLQMAVSGMAEEFNVSLRSRSQQDDGWVQIENRSETWDARETAIIVCDMWDYHHCLNAVRRGIEMAPRMNKVLKNARDRGAIIIHAPSSCMATYADHAARKRAEEIERVDNLPLEIGKWWRRCRR